MRPKFFHLLFPSKSTSDNMLALFSASPAYAPTATRPAVQARHANAHSPQPRRLTPRGAWGPARGVAADGRHICYQVTVWVRTYAHTAFTAAATAA